MTGAEVGLWLGCLGYLLSIIGSFATCLICSIMAPTLQCSLIIIIDHDKLMRVFRENTSNTEFR